MIITRRSVLNHIIGTLVYLGVHAIHFWLTEYGIDGMGNTRVDLRKAICEGWDPCAGETNNISTVARGMGKNLNERLHGQRIARKVIIDTMNKTYKYVDAGMPLGVELYGPPGTGKTYATEIIAEAIFSKGMNSPFVHTFDGEDLQFTEEQLSNYEENLQNWIIGNLTNCKRSMFIFKHSEKIPLQLLNVIQNVIKGEMGGVFLFTTRETDSVISDIYYKTLKRGTKKKYMHIKRFASVLKRSLFGLTTRALFIPMEDIDLKNCMLDEFERQGHSVPNLCMLGKVYKHFEFDEIGYTKMTCKDITEITKYITKNEAC